MILEKNKFSLVNEDPWKFSLKWYYFLANNKLMNQMANLYKLNYGVLRSIV